MEKLAEVDVPVDYSKSSKFTIDFILEKPDQQEREKVHEEAAVAVQEEMDVNVVLSRSLSPMHVNDEGIPDGRTYEICTSPDSPESVDGDDDEPCSSHQALDSERRKRPRTAFTATQIKTLETEFEKNKYLSVAKRVELSKLLGLSQQQLKVWYQNRRTKWKRKYANDLETMAQQYYSSIGVTGSRPMLIGDRLWIFNSPQDVPLRRSMLDARPVPGMIPPSPEFLATLNRNTGQNLFGPMSGMTLQPFAPHGGQHKPKQQSSDVL